MTVSADRLLQDVEARIGFGKDRQGGSAKDRRILAGHADHNAGYRPLSVGIDRHVQRLEPLGKAAHQRCRYAAAEYDGLRIEGKLQKIEGLPQRLDGLIQPGIEAFAAFGDQRIEIVGRKLPRIRNAHAFVSYAWREITIQAAALAAAAEPAMRLDDYMPDLACIVAAALVEMAVEKHSGADAAAPARNR